MPNTIGLAGGTPQKQVRFAPMKTGRWYGGLCTNRSPLRDATTNRITEKFYGAAGDALIDGSNVEITNRLTLARRPGNPVFDSNSYTAIDRFYPFHLSGPSTEQIDVMVDQANALYSLFEGTKSLVWAKTAGAGQSYMQEVGNSLYFGNGEDNKKWLQTVLSWQPNAKWGTAGTPFLSTFIIDPNGNIQQLANTQLSITGYSIASNVITATVSNTQAADLTQQLSVAEVVNLSGFAISTFLNGQQISIASVTTHTFTGTLEDGHSNTTTTENGVGQLFQDGTPISQGTAPTWSTVVPAIANNFQGGLTLDGTVQWINRGAPTENWGIQPPLVAPDISIGSSRVAWAKNTYYSFPGVIIDSNGGIQQVTGAGISGSTPPAWQAANSGVNTNTNDGTVLWTKVETAAATNWTAHTAYNPGTYLVANAAGTNCLFQLAPIGTGGGGVTLSSSVAISLWAVASGSTGGQFTQSHTAPVSPDATDTGNSLMFNAQNTSAQPMQRSVLNGAGETTSLVNLPSPSSSHYNMAASTTMNIPVAGQYTITVSHQNGFYFGFGTNAGNLPVKISGILSNPTGQSETRIGGYTIIGANNNRGGDTVQVDSFVINFPIAGPYPVEFDFAQNDSDQQLVVKSNNFIIPPQPSESGATQPVWPAWTVGFQPGYPHIAEASGQYYWNNLGPVADYVWASKVNFTLPNTTIIDPAGNNEAPYRTGITGGTIPTFATGLNQLTSDNPNLIWINGGPAAAPPAGSVTAFFGWQYAIALVNSLDDTVSNASPLTPSTGPFIGSTGVAFPPGSGLDINKIDPQSDYVAIFRTTDGEATPFLIPPASGNSIWTIPLSEYLANGYVDTTPDVGLDNEIEAPILGENTPPLPGAINLTYHLNRIFFSVGNTVYWTSGPDTPAGNGVNGVSPLNFDELPSLVKRIVPLAVGALVFTVSDIYMIQGLGTATNPIQKATRLFEGVGVSSYNAVDICGSIVGFFTTDNQFLTIDPSSGLTVVGNNIGNLLRQKNGLAGTNWNSQNVYLTWHVDGEDQAWYLADGNFGWYRLMTTPSPETGLTWSPFATIAGAVGAVQSIEVSPGVHKLLLGPVSTGPILNRDLDSFLDNNSVYPAFAVIGSSVFADAGQLAQVSFIMTESVRTGTPLQIGVLMDEALPYYKGPFETLKDWVPDPPEQPKSKSFFAQRFYLHELKQQAPVCRHMQTRIVWNAENAASELHTFTIFGAYLQEE